MWHFRRDNGSFTADQVIAVENAELDAGRCGPGRLAGELEQVAGLTLEDLPQAGECREANPARTWLFLRMDRLA
jgi:hypothetical protein